MFLRLIDYYNLEPTTKWTNLVLLHTLSACGECLKHAFIQQHVRVIQQVFGVSTTFEAIRHIVNALKQKGHIIQDGDFISVNENLFRVNQTAVYNRSNYLLTVFLDVRDLMLLDYIVHWYHKTEKSEYCAMKWDDFVYISPEDFEKQLQITYRQIQNRVNKLIELKFLNKQIISISPHRKITVYQPALQYQAWVNLKKRKILVSARDKITPEIYGQHGLKLVKQMSPKERLSYVEGCGYIQEDLITKMQRAYSIARRENVVECNIIL